MHKLLHHLNFHNPKKVVDIGANVGEFSIQLHKHFPTCQFYLVEANKNCEPHLRKLPFFYEIVALGEEPGEADFYVENENPIATGASLKIENTPYYGEGKFYTERVKIKTLDSRAYFGLDTIDLLKLDVQGSELDILKGGQTTLSRSNYVLLEASNVKYNKEAPLFDEVMDHMTNSGFNLIDVVEFMKINTGIGPVIAQMDVLFQNSNIY